MANKMFSISNLQNALTQFKNKIEGKYDEYLPKIETLETTVDNLNLRSIIGEGLEYGYFNLEINQTTDIGLNKPIKFNIVKNINGMEINLNYGILLKKGRTYELNANIFYEGNGNSDISLQFYNITKEEYIGNSSFMPGVGATATSNTSSCLNIIYTPTVNSYVGLYISSGTIFPTTINANRSNLIAKEIGRTSLIDPANIGDDRYNNNYGSFGLSVNQTTALGTGYYVRLDTKEGILELTNSYTIKLKQGKTYSITSNFGLITTGVGTLAIVDVTNNKNIGKILFDNTFGTSTPYITSSTITYSPPSDCEIAFSIESAVISSIYSSYTKVNIHEINSIISVEYTKEVSNPLTLNSISQETPVGSVVVFIGISIPEHYLKCDGSIYNINEYPDLANHFLTQFGSSNYYGGNGITTFAVPNYSNEKTYVKVSPIMTSNTTPAPYVVSASSIYGSSYDSWIAFDGKIRNNYGWYTANGSKTGWLKIDMAQKTVISAIKLIAGYVVTQFPKSFILWGSNDDVTYFNIKQFDDNSATEGKEYIYDLDMPVNYRFYKLEILSNNGASCSGFDDLELLQGCKMAYVKYKPTYVAINQYGGFESKPIFNGCANTVGVYNLTESLDNYNFLLVESATTKSAARVKVSPVMTSNTLPTPYVASSSTNAGGYEAYKAFNGSTAAEDAWCSNGATSGWLQIDFGASTIIKEIEIVNRNSYYAAQTAPKDYTFQGSNDGINFTIIKEVTGDTVWTSGQTKKYTLDTRVNYRYYRLNITTNNGYNHLGIGELIFYNIPETKALTNNKLIPVNDISLYSKSFTAVEYNKDRASNSFIEYQFDGDTTFKIVDLINDTVLTNSNISKITGIKGQLPTLLSGGSF